jgi:hypothetical protein
MAHGGWVKRWVCRLFGHEIRARRQSEVVIRDGQLARTVRVIHVCRLCGADFTR